jgi:hypothetical protein
LANEAIRNECDWSECCLWNDNHCHCDICQQVHTKFWSILVLGWLTCHA